MGSVARRHSKSARPVGHPGVPDPANMGKDELEERRAILVRLRELSGKAENGDEKAVLGIRELLDASPDLAWRLIKGPGEMAESTLLDAITKDGDLASKELFRHQLESMKMEVAGGNASPLERLLAARVVATWLQVQLFESLYAVGMKGETMSQGEYRQKRLDRAHGRHLTAVRALAQVHKMGPAVQINIAEKQINNAG